MKKIFLFATIAAAGLFVSCSSTDDTIGDAPNSGIESIDDNAAQAIRIGIGNVGAMATRGTGTVGGVVGYTNNDYNNLGELANKWAGQSIRVFMFKKGLPDQAEDVPANYVTSFTPATDKDDNELYNNTEMITPGSAENIIPNMGVTANVAEGEAMIKEGTIQYYPLSGYYDFFGYHLDDALPATADADNYVTTNGDKMTVPFEIDGSQDLMSTKAALTESYDNSGENPVLNGGQKFDINQNPTNYGLQAGQTWSDFTRYYSAYSARRGIQPYLTFNHLLTRFAFFVKAGKESAAGMVAAVPGGNYTDDTAYEHNLTLTGAVKIGDEKEAAEYYTKAECNAWNAANVAGCLATGALLTAAQASAVNTEINTSYNENDPITEDDAYTYNSTKAGSQKTTDVKTPATYFETKSECNNYNKNTLHIVGAVVSGDSYATIPAHQDFGKAVKIKSIKVKSKYKGDMAVAWKGASANLTDAQKLTWSTEGDDNGVKILELKARPYAKQKAGTTLTHADFPDLNKEYLALDPQDEELATKQAAIETRAAARTEITKAMYETLDASIQAGGASEKFVLLDDKVAMNKKLVALDPTPARWDATNDVAVLNPVGEALLVGPTDQDDKSYYLEIEVAQDLPTNWNPELSQDKERTVISKYRLKAPDANGFQPNTSYNIILTVYSLERIEVIAIITPWNQATDDIPVGGDQ